MLAPKQRVAPQSVIDAEAAYVKAREDLDRAYAEAGITRKPVVQARHYRIKRMQSDDDYRKKIQDGKKRRRKKTNEKSQATAHRKGARWTDYEDDILRKIYDTTKSTEIAKKLNRTFEAIRSRVGWLRTNGKWKTKSEEQ